MTYKRKYLDITLSHIEQIQDALPELEKLIQIRLGFKPKLSARIRNQAIKIESNNLIGELGKTLVKTIFTEIHISFWGGDRIFTDDTAENEIIWFNPKISYRHPGGGTNGTDFIWVGLWYNFTENKWVEGTLIYNDSK